MLVRAITSLLAVTLGSSAVVAHGNSSPIEIGAALGQSVIAAGETQRVHVRVAIKGVRRSSEKARAPMNIALVIDRSGSMSGRRIEEARRAAQMAVDRLSPSDIVSVVSYDDRVEIEVPATKATDRAGIKERIARLTPRGSTAIWAGMQAGAAEIRKFKSSERVNRIILLSDGLANVGPASPDEFARLGRQLAGEGMTVSTLGLGLGYNEDLMARLASAADGAHAFVQEPADLAQFLAREFDDALGVTAQEVEIIITLAPGVKPMRSLGREARIEGQKIIYSVGQIIGGAEQVLLAEMEVAAAAGLSSSDLVAVEISYRDAASGQRETRRSAVAARIGTTAEAQASIDPIVARDVAVIEAREQRQEAIKLRDAGRIEESQRAFEANRAKIQSIQQSVPQAAGYAPLDAERKASETGAAPAAATADGWAKARKIQRGVDVNQSGSSTRY
jgi:Ca-activated chloride channel homolog